ncbi:MAG: glycosyltransferase family 4 protein [Bryobacteraceae bacterium]
MKVIIATSIFPFVEGGATFIVDWLGQELRRRGHDVEIFELPFSGDFKEIADQLLAYRLIDLTGHGDVLIAIRTPSHLLQHHNKKIWFIHHYRGAYDLWGTEFQNLPNTPEGVACRSAILAADNLALGEATQVFSNSKVVRDRLKHFNQIEAEVLYPPLLSPEKFYPTGSAGYILYFGRLTRHKRQWLAIEALRHTRSAVRLIIAGRPDPGEDSYLSDLKELAAKYRIVDRIEFSAGWISDARKYDLFAASLAVAYFPFDEDSYGYISLEAAAAQKAVLTTTDAGGVIELISDRLNGLVIPPDPELIGASMDRLFLSPEETLNMGKASPARVNELGIGWDRVCERLLA